MFVKILSKVKDFYVREPVEREARIFWLHCNVTTSFLLGMTSILGCVQLVGNPIYCQVRGIPKGIANIYCWMMSTYAMPDAFYPQAEDEIYPAHPGVVNDERKESEKKYYVYYQWVPVVLFLQALFCYAPKYIWISFEGGRLKSLTSGLMVKILTEEEKQKEKKILVDYLVKHVNKHVKYTAVYFFCEFLCFVNMVAQFYFMDVFFRGDFLKYGYNILFFDELPQEQRIDYMVYVFPEVTKCNIYKFGPSGSLELRDGMCFLALNRVNQKTYVFLWFWFVMLSIGLGFIVLLRLIDTLFPYFRIVHIVEFKNEETTKLWRRMIKKMSFGDRFILYMLSWNLNNFLLREIVVDFISALEMLEERSDPSV